MRSPKKKVGKVSRRTARTTFPVVVNFQFDEGSCEYRGSLGSQKVSVLKLQNCRDQITGNVLILSAAKAGEIAAELEAKPNEWWLLPKETRPQSVSIALRAKVTFESKLAMPLAIVNWARPTAPATAIAISPAKK